MPIGGFGGPTGPTGSGPTTGTGDNNFNSPSGDPVTLPTDGINSCFKQCYLQQGVSLDGFIFPYCDPL